MASRAQRRARLVRRQRHSDALRRGRHNLQATGRAPELGQALRIGALLETINELTPRDRERLQELRAFERCVRFTGRAVTHGAPEKVKDKVRGAWELLRQPGGVGTCGHLGEPLYAYCMMDFPAPVVRCPTCTRAHGSSHPREQDLRCDNCGQIHLPRNFRPIAATPLLEVPLRDKTGEVTFRAAVQIMGMGLCHRCDRPPKPPRP